jgi:hypothetical protein
VIFPNRRILDGADIVGPARQQEFDRPQCRLVVSCFHAVPREVFMRIPALGILALITALTSVPALAQTYSRDYPVCMQAFRWGGSDIDCSYTSLAQCAASASGLGAMCMANPYFTRAQLPREPSYRRHRRVD